MGSRKAILWLIGITIWLSGFMTAKCFAGESTLVMSDNTRITTREIYQVIPTTTRNPVAPVISNPIADHDCFDRIQNIHGIADRYAAIDKCKEVAD
jgi:hypothetical protein